MTHKANLKENIIRKGKKLQIWHVYVKLKDQFPNAKQNLERFVVFEKVPIVSK